MTTTIDEARAELDRAQAMLERCQREVAAAEAMIPALQEALAHMHELNDWYSGVGQDHIETVLAAGPDTVTAPVADQDTVWDTAVALDNVNMRLLRIITAEVTAPLDQPEDSCAIG